MHALFFEPPLYQNAPGNILAEIYKDRIYAPFTEGKNDLIILDVGANIGWTSYYFSQFAKQVYSLEPSTEHFNVFTQMLEYNQIKNVKPIKKALYIESGTFPLYDPGSKYNNKTMRSLHQAMANPEVAPEQVQTITLDQLFKDEGIEHVDLMKLDVEGSESEILSHSSFAEVAPKIDTILIELHSWSGRHPNQVKEALKNNGFEVETMPSDAEILVAKRK